MDSFFSSEIKLIFILALSVGCFAWMKYIKKSDLGWKIGLSLGLVILSIGWFGASTYYTASNVIEFLLLRGNPPYPVERFILIGYCFILIGIMSFIDEFLNKISRCNGEE